MISQGTKLFGGLSVATLIGLTIYGFSNNFTDVAAISLWFMLGVLVLFTGVAAMTHDANVSPMDEAAVRTASNTLPPASPSAWPVVAAAGGAVVLIGVVTDKRYFIGGIVVVAIALFEWTVSAWADRASADQAFNGKVRGRILNPIEFPIAAALGLGTLVYSFSRIMLTSNTDVAPVLFGLFGALILFGGLILAANPKLRRSVVAGVLAVASIGVAGAGVWAASNGQNPKLTEEHQVALDYKKDGPTCDATAQAAKDDNPDGAVAAKSSTTGTFTFGADGKLTLHQFSGSLPGQPLTVDRGNITNILFKNEHPGEYRLTIYGGKVQQLDPNGNPQKDPDGKPVYKAIQFCTSLIGEGKTQLLTFKLNLPSVYGTDQFYAEVPGVTPPARVQIVVP